MLLVQLSSKGFKYISLILWLHTFLAKTEMMATKKF